MKETMKKPVLVVGGGIGGIQAAHDLAEMGIPVILVEKSPSIGGRMARSTRPFPRTTARPASWRPR
jgi:heterodisulfide reductase subunit A-like polyferredoxin